ncbi:MAG: AAA family ATPase [Alphaproteobacteria bacterium]|jgi:putative DNA primase/helicase|nr:AAA family ATPase [Alphaproteobacteria bacterium]MBP7729746.1 AAA family ATPase [Alphaproteobacteria bacterium]
MSVINVKERINRAESYIALQTEQTRPPLRSLNVRELLELEIPPREIILSPILPAQGLVMFSAPRGIGKTHVALWMAYTIACGGEMFNKKWQCEKPYKVLFVDGEMPASTLQMRLSSIVASSDKELEDVDNLKIITPDHQEVGIPNLCTTSGQEWLEPHLKGTNLLILDNLSSLCRSGRENESESWNPLQGWLLKLRKEGISVLFVHHAGKGGNQRGTSKKEDILDTVIVLRKPNDYDQREGARFEVHYEKARSFYGEEASPFEAWLKGDHGTMTWQVQEIEDVQLNNIIDLHKDGLKQREIAQELGIGLGTVNRGIKRAKKEGKVK